MATPDLRRCSSSRFLTVSGMGPPSPVSVELVLAELTNELRFSAAAAAAASTSCPVGTTAPLEVGYTGGARWAP